MDGLVESLTPLVEVWDQKNISGLLFQHIVLCPTRTWLHYNRVDCAHLNRHMQAGILLHATAYEGDAERLTGYGIHPDLIDWAHRTVSEVKPRKGDREATRLQLAFYMAVLTVTTGESWKGLIRLPESRKVVSVSWSPDLVQALVRYWGNMQQVIAEPLPPPAVHRPVCTGCAYQLLCWGGSTEEADA